MTKRKGLSPTAPESHLIDIIAYKEAKKVLKDASEVDLAGPLAKGMINVFIAQSGSGKSLCAFLVAFEELRNRHFDAVYYIDVDNPHSIYKDRYMNFPDLEGMFYLTEYILDKFIPDEFGAIPTEKAVSLLKDFTEEKYAKNKLIVIDSLQNIADYNDLRELKKFFRILKGITNAGGTILVIHHKSSKNEAPNFKGLSYIKDASDVVWEVNPNFKKTGEKTGEISNFKLSCTKNRSTTNFVSFIVAFNTDTGTVNYDENVLFEDEIPIKEAVLKILREKPNQKQADVVQATRNIVNVNEKKVRSVLAKMVALNILTTTTGPRNAKLYSVNTEGFEVGYLDGLGEEV